MQFLWNDFFVCESGKLQKEKMEVRHLILVQNPTAFYDWNDWNVYMQSEFVISALALCLRSNLPNEKQEPTRT